MDRALLEECLSKGMSLDAIGELVGRHPSTVSYWLQKHGLEANGHDRHAPKGEVDLARLEALVGEGASIRRIADELGRSYSTIRRQIQRLDLKTDRMLRIAESTAARESGVKKAYLK